MRLLKFQPLHTWLGFAAAIATTGCQLAKQQMTIEATSATAVVRLDNAAYEAASANQGSMNQTIQLLGHDEPQLFSVPNSDDDSATANESGVARVRSTSARIPLPESQAGLQTSHLGGRQVYSDLRTAKFSPSEPRLQLTAQRQIIGDEETLLDQVQSRQAFIGSHSDQYPDEYIFDGGDRDHPVHRDDLNRLGLDTEDTVAEFLDHRGKLHREQTNRVAIYAPRFASVRTVAAPSGDVAIARLGGLQDAAYDAGLKAKVGPDTYEGKDQLRGVKTRSRVSGVENQLAQLGVGNVRRLSTHTKLLNLYENNAFLQRGEFDQNANARLAFGLKAAMHWTRDQNPVATAQIDTTSQFVAKFKVAEMTGIDEEHLRDGKLRIVKLADKTTAQSGDVITFVIRYDNLGDRPLQHIKVVDNLTPRLEYIEDSAESDRDGDIQVDDNQEGSSVLTFTLDEPLPGKTGGVISFQCRVR